MKALPLPTVCMDVNEGRSAMRLGGRPRLPPSQPWPHRGERPLDYLAEIDLRVIREIGGPDWLPDVGFLHVFYDAERQPWGFDPADRDGWAVLMTPDLAVSPDPGPDGSQREQPFSARALGGRLSVSYPHPERLNLPGPTLATYDIDEVYAFLEGDVGSEPQHRLGGYPSPIQNDTMELESQLASNGIYVGDAEGYRTAAAKALESGVADWKLLLQLDSDETSGMMWGDGGRLYFWIREQDARAGDFSKVWTILQCH